MRHMKQLLILILLLASLTGISKEKLRYNLNVGDEFTYKLESNTKEGSSTSTDKRWIKFNVLDKDAEGYTIQYQLLRLVKSSPWESFDTKGITASQRISHKVDKATVGEKFSFHLSFDGTITKSKISKQLKDRILLKAGAKGIFDKMEVNNVAFISPMILNNTLRGVFIQFPKNKVSQWTRTDTIPNQQIPISTDYTLDSKDNSISILQNTQYETDDTLTTNAPMYSNMPVKISYNATYSIDKQTGLIHSMKANGANKSSFISRSTTNAKSKMQQSAKSNTVIQKVDPTENSSIIIAGEVSKRAPGDSIQFFLWNQCADRDVFRAMAHIDSNKQFKIKSTLSRPIELTHTIKDMGYVSSHNQMLLEPGDSIFLSVDDNQNIYFSGKGAYKCNLYHKLSHINAGINESMTPKEALSKASQAIEERLSIIEEHKDSLSDWAYDNLKTNAFFSQQRSLLSYYYNSNGGEVNKEMFHELFDDISFEGYNDYTSQNFRFFMESYIFRQLLILHNNKHNRHHPANEGYMLSKIYFNGKLEYYALAFYVFDALKGADKSRAEDIYHDFQQRYPGTELAQSLKKMYDNSVNLDEGSIAPDFTLKDLSGNEVRLSDYKDKWIFLTFCDLRLERYQKVLLAYQKMAQELPENHFQFIAAFSNDDPQATKDFLKEHAIDGVLLDNHGWKNDGAKKYKLESSDQHFLINPDGEVEFSGSITPLEHSIISFISYIQKDIKDRAENEEAGIDIWVVLFFILGISLGLGATYLFYRLRMSRLRKKEGERRERLELEMQAVRSQLNPHFLFNSMNSIQHLVNADENEKANIFLSKFGSLMRKVLNQSEEELIPLADELETISTYLELEALRHRFTYAINVEEGIDQYNIEIPPMLLQPFVENAVVHGINGMNTNGKIAVEVSRLNGDHIRIQIIDNGKGLHHKCSSKQSNGKGLHITQRRVDLMMEKFKHDISIDLKDAKESEATTTTTGTIAEIIVELEQ
ncbi:redoxin domain-containing protein [Puteibacter caeruleilacunae]|nr:redoxin domain-containing protein [Puteibacter caeruleilacunae]